MSASTHSSKSVPFCLRMPLGHRDKLIAAAKERNRSLVNFLVEAGLVEAGRKLEPEPAKLPRRHIPDELAA